MEKNTFGTIRDFTARVRFAVAPNDSDNEARPLALLLGSGVSIPSIPSVEKIAFAIRSSLSPEDRPEYDEFLIDSPTSGEKYQRAFQFLSMRRPREFRDRIITSSVLGAYQKEGAKLDRRLTKDELYAAEIDTDNWALPPGQAALGRIWAGLPARLRGPVITTNFDPLFEVSLRRAGMPASTHIIDGDGSLQQAPRLSDNAAVMHIHGFWREGATLSKLSELSRSRPLLSSSLRALLARHTLLVLGYSGWNDAVTRALDNVISDTAGDGLDVLWCSYGDAARLRSSITESRVLSSLERSPSVTFYSGCDANEWIPALENSIAEHLHYDDSSRSSASLSSIPGFDLVVPDQYTDSPEVELRARAISFLDGREPSIRDGFNPMISSRDALSTIHNQLAPRIGKGGPTLTFITGAAGEGKSTLACQLAARLAKFETNAVLFSKSGRVSQESILTASATQQTILVIDDAHESFSELRGLCQRLNDEAPRSLHIIATARDTDWASLGGFRFAWDRYIDFKSYRLRGLSHLDASSIVRSWESLGGEALGDLREIPTFDARVGELLRLSKSEDSDTSTLFGASLEIRYGAGLREHIRQLVIRLSDIISPAAKGSFESRNSSLAYPLFLASIPQVYGTRGTSKAVLAGALELSQVELDILVLPALGDEAPVSITGPYVYARHKAIAKAVIDASIDAGFSVRDAMALLVSSAVTKMEESGYDPAYAELAYLSRNIADEELALLAAEAAYSACPARLSYSSRLSSAYRRSGRIDDAVVLGAESIAKSWKAPDRDTTLRVALNEYGVALGSKKHFIENVQYGLLSLADIPGVTPFRATSLEYPLSCLGLAGCNAWESERVHGFMRGVESVLFLIDRFNFTGVRPDWLRRYRSVILNGGGKWVTDASEAVAGLIDMAESVFVHGNAAKAPGLPSRVQFNSLMEIVVDEL
ncbi:P-loop NTPase [Brachybacterium alimentarium]|uniref:P-loop NTPase n=1 Tax=Brachybacterium alimentarium TaxID=47845 RepID=UPI003FD0737E